MEDLVNGTLTDNSSLAQDSAVFTLFLHLLFYLARLFNFLSLQLCFLLQFKSSFHLFCVQQRWFYPSSCTTWATNSECLWDFLLDGRLSWLWELQPSSQKLPFTHISVSLLFTLETGNWRNHMKSMIILSKSQEQRGISDASHKVVVLPDDNYGVLVTGKEDKAMISISSSHSSASLSCTSS